MDNTNEIGMDDVQLAEINKTANFEQIENKDNDDCTSCSVSEEIEYGDASVYMVEDIEKEVNLMNEKLQIHQSSSFDLKLLSKLELEANRIATSVDGLTENLTGLLHSISALTVDCLGTYGKAVGKTCDAVDYNIKLMYQLMAKCEELSKISESLNELHQYSKDIKHVLEMFESAVNL